MKTLMISDLIKISDTIETTIIHYNRSCRHFLILFGRLCDYHKLLDQSLSHCFSSSILSNFRQYFNNILANKPANPPDFDVYEDLIDKKAANAKSKIDATAGASAAEKAAAKAQVYY